MTNAFVLKVRAFFARWPPATSTVSCAVSAEAYMNACLAAPFLCYVSPAIYGLSSTRDERGATQRSSQPGDAV
jgi:hypothetical protein